MKRSDFFKNAVWVGAPEKNGETPAFSILRGHFEAKKGETARLFVLGLGWFRAYINGVCVNPDSFLPLSSDYEPRPEPSGEVLSGHRICVPSFDVSHLLRDGDNVTAIHYGGGWYTYGHSRFGAPKAIWRVELPGRDAVSSAGDRIAASFITEYRMERFEKQDHSGFDHAVFGAGFDDSPLPRAVAARPLETEYVSTDCPADKVCELIRPVLVKEAPSFRVYDCKKNISGRPVIRLDGKKGEKCEAVFSEELGEDLLPHPAYVHKQSFTAVSDGTGRTVRPEFIWYGFRYFSLSADASVESVEVIHADVPVSSGFECGNETLNQIYRAFVDTQLANMHGGIPSDCPHIERRGYTGDGQLCCRAAMTVLDALPFYKKWIDDVSDCQDSLSGHVQYTAPYIRSGGGPGGWGCAIVELPYQYWLFSCDPGPFTRLYPQMMKYFSYLEAHSRSGFVVSDREGEWCLGDWCTPEKMILPPAFVNNYFYIRSMRRVLAFSDATGFLCDRALLEARIAERCGAITAAYMDPRDDSFLGGAQGADAFALALGLGSEKTRAALVQRYEKRCSRDAASRGVDTGIFGTELVCRELFRQGEARLAVDFLTCGGDHSFSAMFAKGATTLWEYFPGSLRERSHSHPMFGAVTALLFEYLLGIDQPEGSAGFERLVIAPRVVPSLGFARGHRNAAKGRVSVEWRAEGENVRFSVTVPPDTPARFVFGGTDRELSAGENSFSVCLE